MTKLKEPELHYARDRRCYNGAFCSDLQREFDSQDAILAAIKQKHPRFSCTYYPAEGKYLCWDEPVDRWVEVTGNFHEDRGQALLEAWRVLIGKGES